MCPILSEIQKQYDFGAALRELTIYGEKQFRHLKLDWGE